MLKRYLDLKKALKKGKSMFLFGPRSTGKTHLILDSLKGKHFYIDLLNSVYFNKLTDAPNELLEIITAQKHKLIVIDEVQKIPILLDEIHRILENKNVNYQFLLTGSSARKLKKSAANLLGGRAGRLNLFPLVSAEIHNFELEKYLNFGGVPRIYLSENPAEELYDYVENYINEEIKLEAAVRNLPPFRRFLKAAALTNSQLINYSNFASDVGVSVPTVKEYFNILEDTLIGFRLEPWRESKKRKAIATAKFYFFDTGVTNALAKTEKLDRNSNLWGQAFEQFIGMELRAYLSYSKNRSELTFWRTTSGHEVDFLVGEKVAIEVKATNKIKKEHLVGLMAIKEEKRFSHLILISNEKIDRTIDGVLCLYWENFLEQLWRGDLFS